MKKFLICLALLLALLLPAAAFGESTAADLQPMAEDISKECLLNGYLDNQTMNKMLDGNYRTYWKSVRQNGVCELIITPPRDRAVGALLIRWRSEPVAVSVQVRDAGDWRTVAEADADFQAQYIALPAVTKEMRIVARDNPKTVLQICELTVMTPGALPEDFQVWQKHEGKMDMMLLSGHPDDEVLWFGGLLPTYAGAREKRVLVVCAAFNSYNRRLELLDCLWTCGVRIHPIFAGYLDLCTSDINEVYKAWGRQKVQQHVAALYRQYRPDVVVLHDVKGEYGHGVHRAFSDAGRKAVELAADATQDAASLEAYGAWQVPKVYVHLLADNQLQMDWHVPLARFGGKTGQEVAREAFKCHVSQQGKRWQVEDGGKWDNSLFGLYFTAVGPDLEKNDLFEHIE